MKTLRFLSLVPLFSATLLGSFDDPGKDSAQYFIDIHEFGPNNVTASAVAEAHEKDLLVQQKHGVRFLEYWVDEGEGRVYCLSEAPNAHSITDTHREAHGLLPAKILHVTPGEAALATGDCNFFLDVHKLGAGAVTPDAVAEAHKLDLDVQDRHGVHFINYWVDEQSGTVMCLSEAPDSDSVVETHREAHGLIPASVARVAAGR